MQVRNPPWEHNVEVTQQQLGAGQNSGRQNKVDRAKKKRLCDTAALLRWMGGVASAVDIIMYPGLRRSARSLDGFLRRNEVKAGKDQANFASFRTMELEGRGVCGRYVIRGYESLVGGLALGGPFETVTQRE